MTQEEREAFLDSTSSCFFGRNGESLTFRQAERFLSDPEYRILKQERLPNGLVVSTVWLGVDHGAGDELILFETKVFQGWMESKTGLDVDTYRYTTEKEAFAGHDTAVSEWSKRPSLEVVR